MGMEPDTSKFFVLIVNTMAIVLIWMIAQVLIGIYFGFAFFEQRPDWKNLLYYVFCLGTLLLLIRHLRKKWKDVDLR
jgi:ABC-type glycerol-3-phosphate transport system permease component